MICKLLKTQDVMRLTGYGRNRSYQIIKELNEELEASGRMVFKGKVDAEFFMQKVYGRGWDEDDGQGDDGVQR